MTISSSSHLQRSAAFSSPDTRQGLVSEPAQGDIDTFSAALHGAAEQGGPAMAGPLASALSARLGDSEKLSQQALRQMRKAAVAEDGTSIIQMSRALSQCSLQMALTTKVVSKGAQALDKLTNLQ